MPVSTPKRSRRVLIAITTSSIDVLPARSPMPFTVHSTCRAPFCTAASEFATAMPRSLWQWALQMDVGGGDEDVDPGPPGLLHRLEGAVDVLLARAGEREDDRLRDHLRDAPDGLEVALRGGGEPRLDHVHAQVLELARDRELLLHVHGGAGRLLPVAQGRVEDLYPVHRRSPLRQLVPEKHLGPRTARPVAPETKKPRGGDPARGILSGR